MCRIGHVGMAWCRCGERAQGRILSSELLCEPGLQKTFSSHSHSQPHYPFWYPAIKLGLSFGAQQSSCIIDLHQLYKYPTTKFRHLICRCPAIQSRHWSRYPATKSARVRSDAAVSLYIRDTVCPLIFSTGDIRTWPSTVRTVHALAVCNTLGPCDTSLKALSHPY